MKGLQRAKFLSLCASILLELALNRDENPTVFAAYAALPWAKDDASMAFSTDYSSMIA